ncbi:MAG: TRAP transporter small permease, partial [Bacteroidota bacterium]
MSVFKKFDSLLNKFEGGLLVLLLAAMVVMAFLQVILRNGFNSTILWVDILLRHLVLWTGFLGAALATSSERHINIDAFTRFLSPRVRSVVNTLTSMFAVAMCWFLLDASVTYVKNEMIAGSTIYADIPTWYSALIIPIGFGLLILHFSVRTILSASAALKNEVTS